LHHAFDPFFAFYGGTLYAVVGALAVVVAGQVIAGYVISVLLAIVAGYGGCLWLARQLGASTWRAHALAITFVSSAYYITNVYGRGAGPEFVAVSVIPLLAASGLAARTRATRGIVRDVALCRRRDRVHRGPRHHLRLGRGRCSRSRLWPVATGAISSKALLCSGSYLSWCWQCCIPAQLDQIQFPYRLVS
jgi:hypothetical protein